MVESESTRYTIGLLKKNYLPEYGVTNLKPVIDEMVSAGQDVASRFKALYKEGEKDPDSEAAEYSWHTADVLRSLSQRGVLGRRDARFLLSVTEDLGKFDSEEYFKTINALSHNPTLASLLVGFAREKIKRHNVQDWRWLAFCAVSSLGMLIEKGAVVVPEEVLTMLDREIPDEKDERKKSHFAEVIEYIRSVQREGKNGVKAG